MKKNIALLLIIVCTGQSYAAGEAKKPDFGTLAIKQTAGDLEEFPLDSDEGIDEVTDSEFLKYLEPSIEEKEINLIVEEIKKRNDDYAEENKALRSEKEKYKGKVDAMPAFLEALNYKYGFLSNQLGSAEIKEDIDQFVRTLGTQ